MKINKKRPRKTHKNSIIFSIGKSAEQESWGGVKERDICKDG